MSFVLWHTCVAIKDSDYHPFTLSERQNKKETIMYLRVVIFQCVDIPWILDKSTSHLSYNENVKRNLTISFYITNWCCRLRNEQQYTKTWYFWTLQQVKNEHGVGKKKFAYR